MLFIDFETASESEIKGSKSVGLYNYFHHPSTKILMMAYAFDNEPVQIWFPILKLFLLKLSNLLKTLKLKSWRLILCLNVMLCNLN